MSNQKNQKNKGLLRLVFGAALTLAVFVGIAAPAPAGASGVYFAANPTQACTTQDCLIDTYVNPGIKVLSAMVGVAVVISLVMAGIQYSSAAGDPSKVGAAKDRIAKTIGALIMYIFLYAFLNYIIPGGV